MWCARRALTALHCATQGEDRDLVWTFYQLRCYLQLACGIFAVIFSIMWVVNIALFMLPKTPYSPALNALIVLDSQSISAKAYFQNMAVFIFMALLLSHLFLCTFAGLRQLQNSLKCFAVGQPGPPAHCPFERPAGCPCA